MVDFSGPLPPPPPPPPEAFRKSAQALENGRTSSWKEGIKPRGPRVPAQKQLTNKAAAPAAWYYFDRNNVQHGPVSDEQLSRLYDGEIVHDLTYVWNGACSGWTALHLAPLEYVPAQYGV